MTEKVHTDWKSFEEALHTLGTPDPTGAITRMMVMMGPAVPAPSDDPAAILFATAQGKTLIIWDKSRDAAYCRQPFWNPKTFDEALGILRSATDPKKEQLKIVGGKLYLPPPDNASVNLELNFPDGWDGDDKRWVVIRVVGSGDEYQHQPQLLS